jgi:hypothetical protein
MWRARPVPFAGSVTTNASRVRSGEYCKSAIERKFNDASGVSNLPLSAAVSLCPCAHRATAAVTSKSCPQVLKKERQLA